MTHKTHNTHTTHKEKNSNSGRMILVWILIAGILFYGISSSNLFAWSKKNIYNTVSPTTTSASSCNMWANGWWCGCGWGARKTSTANSCAWTTNTATTTTAPVTTPTDTDDSWIVSTVAYETVNVWHTAFALNPETVTLSAGKSYKLIITPTENGGWCMGTMTIPGIDENVYPIKAGQPITITIDNAQAGNYEVICWAMGMYQWSIIIQ
ncbi:MAG: hypothetical protein ACD_80C00170G0001 [uncultured bacterium (gcode 4)]|uniref:EfeO-type cupredoxin-like domain-containing protein n=1 Tax=uncultured bacterium (gcode 4) TaxID=1234023 RepID=K1XHY6_9BACT|nr:MAG: hypothetical protein ACD_80C00170G0001 [uncultured bacterium (gcode 4)]